MVFHAHRTCILLFTTLLILLNVAPVYSDASDPPAKESDSDPSVETRKKVIGDFNEITPALRRAVDQGLDFLANGIMSSPNGSASGQNYTVAITALSGLAFLSNGETPSRGEHSAALRRCLNYILSHTDLSTGLIAESRGNGLMYTHGFATLFLAQVYGTTRSIRVRRALRAAVHLIEKTQGPGGGWTYQPIAQSNRYDMSIGVCQTMALRAARNVGVSVSRSVIKNAIQCAVRARTSVAVKRAGTIGFSYQSRMPGSSGPTFAVTSGALCILYGLGVYEDNGKASPNDNPGILIRPAQNFLLNHLRNLQRGTRGGQHVFNHYYYSHYYSVQAMAHAGGGYYWGRWFPPLRDAILRIKGARRSWPNSGYGEYYATAMAVLILTVPYQYLPILDH